MSDAHRICAFTVTKALSEILPEGDKEKQMLQGLLGSKERVVSEVRQEQLWKSEEILNASLYSQHHKWFRYW